MGHSHPLLHLFSSFSNKFTEKNCRITGLRTRIVGVEGKHADIWPPPRPKTCLNFACCNLGKTRNQFPKIFEDNLGKTEQTYTSPIDFPETGIRYELPFVTTSNIDYKRGLLKKEMIYNNNLIKRTFLLLMENKTIKSSKLKNQMN